MSENNIIKFLVVDDDEDVRDLTQETIESCFTNVQVDTHESPQGALDKIKAKGKETLPYHIIITDYHMPGMTGYQMLGKIALEYADTMSRSVIVTGKADEVIKEIPSEVHVIAKPFSRQAGRDYSTGEYHGTERRNTSQAGLDIKNTLIARIFSLCKDLEYDIQINRDAFERQGWLTLPENHNQ